MVDGFGIPRLLAGLAPKGLSNLATSAVTVEENGNRAGGQEGGDVRRREFGKAIMISLVTIPTSRVVWSGLRERSLSPNLKNIE